MVYIIIFETNGAMHVNNYLIQGIFDYMCLYFCELSCAVVTICSEESNQGY